MNPRPLGYEPSELPDCSTPRCGGEVTLVSMGPEVAAEAIRKGLSMGADKGVLVSDDALQEADALMTARALAAAISRAPFDLVIAGRTVVPNPFANKSANSGPKSDASIEEVKDERPAQ